MDGKCIMDNAQNQQITEKPIRKVAKYKQLSIQEKIEVITLVEEGEQKAAVAKKYKITAGAITKILKNKEKYKLQDDNSKANKNRTRVDKGKNCDLEELLIQWFKQKRSLGICVTGPLLKKKALFFNQQLNGPVEFKASQGWLSNFKNRFGIGQLSVQDERLSADADGATEFKENSGKIISEEGYPLDNVYNADETGLYIKSLPQRSLALIAEKQAPGYNESKERVTIMNCSNATGSHKVPLLMIGKSARPRCFKNVAQLPVVYRGQKSAWMNNQELMSAFLGSANVKEEARDDEEGSGEIAMDTEEARDDEEGRGEIAEDTDSESGQDAEFELPIQENIQTMKKMNSLFQRFKKIYQTINECSQEDAVFLNRMEHNIRTKLYNLMYEKKPVETFITETLLKHETRNSEN